MRLLLLAPLLLSISSSLPVPADEPAPPGSLQGMSSPRLALPVILDVAPALAKKPDVPLLLAGRPGKTRGRTAEPVEALTRYALDVARRHFEDAEWSAETLKAAGASTRGARKARAKKKGQRVVVIKKVEIETRQGPVYTVRVVVDRLDGGRRRGQATGTGSAVPDRSQERRRAAFAPGLLGAVAAQKASSPRADRDAGAIRNATLRALDQALYQLAAYWAAEQAADRRR